RRGEQRGIEELRPVVGHGPLHPAGIKSIVPPPPPTLTSLPPAADDYYARLADLDFAQARRQVDEHL
ncbi:hypothetical protein G3I24_47895, partial [Micromonospora aurantiaca]|nr:hypothetical protein [Micromonospora aurantiaca]